MLYDHKKIEKKWQSVWEKENTFAAHEHDSEYGEKFYSLETFPYPSAAGLHVGHPEGYTAEDIQARYLRMKGKNVLYTMGWDAFGLPTENYAIKIGKSPKEVAADNIANFKRQVKMFGFSYDWSREINTSDQSYYRWTQWLFLQLYKNGLAYFAEAPVNWCPSCKTVLANEQVEDGKCERCKTLVEQKMMKQWFLKITGTDPKGKNGAYPERLLTELEGLDWPEPTKVRQREWIGKSEGAEIEFIIKDHASSIKIFTTRPDTLFGATYMVLAPEHELIQKLKPQIKNWEEVETYIEQTRRKTELERKIEEKEKTGVKLEGVDAINPANQETIPIFIADYVLMGYGTGAIMAVPAHDKRDFAFAKKFNLPIRQVISSSVGESAEVVTESYEGEGNLINSEMFDGLSNDEAKHKITKSVEGKPTLQYKLRDWLVSRQRYWGAPIPMIECSECGWVPVPEKDLPVLLPDDVDFRPTGVPPLASSEKFINANCPKCGKPAKRSAETLDTFVDSSWYYLRYTDPTNDQAFAEPTKIEYWMPVDLYIIGAEHTVLHLLYSRFITKALHDLGYLSFDEPFKKLRHIGLILGADGQKMSKSRGNVVNPDEVVEVYGADTFRLYEMFLGPLNDFKPWSTENIAGVRRFLERVWHIVVESGSRNSELSMSDEQSKEFEWWNAKTIKKVTEDIEAFRYNTAISAMMEFVNYLYTVRDIAYVRKDEALQNFLRLLYPFAPHITSELWEIKFATAGFIWDQPWPTYNPDNLTTETYTVAIQINGKLRGTITVAHGISEEEIITAAKNEPNVMKWLVGRKTIKTVVVPNKLVNFVIGDAN